MANGIRTGDPRGFKEGHSSKFREGSWVQQKPEEGWRTYLRKRCGNNNKDEDNSPKTLNDKNQQASSQKFRQQTPEEGRRTYQPKRCGNNNKDEDNRPKTLNDKNQQASSQKFWQLKWNFFQVCSFVNTTVWMHHIDTRKSHWEKARWELHKNAACCFEQILEATTHRIAVE